MGIFINIKENDNVGVALIEIQKGTKIQVKFSKNKITEEANHSTRAPIDTVVTKERIPTGHKFAIKDIKKSSYIQKYGRVTGFATEDIEKGQLVHPRNMKITKNNVSTQTYQEPLIAIEEMKTDRFFHGFQRENGEIGIRNDIWIISTAGYVDSLCANIAREANLEFSDRDIDGIYAFHYPSEYPQADDDPAKLRRILNTLTNHGNAAGVLVVGSALENNHPGLLNQTIRGLNENRVMFIDTQASEDPFEDALEKLAQLVAYAEQFKRNQFPLSRLKIGLKCGGPDGLFGITTLESQSVNSSQKGNAPTITDVLSYVEACSQKRSGEVSLLENPLASMTALVAAGAHIVLFITEKGSPHGGAVPTIKVSTNTDLYQHKPRWIDFNAGSLLQGVAMESVNDELCRYILAVANGKRTNNEQFGFKEIAIPAKG